jgi:hypothetical protein
LAAFLATPSYAASILAGSPFADCSSFGPYFYRLLPLWPLLKEAATPLASFWRPLLHMPPLLAGSSADCSSFDRHLSRGCYLQRLLLLWPLLIEASPPLATTYRGCSSFGHYLQMLLLIWPLLTEAAPPLATTYRGCSSFGRYISRGCSSFGRFLQRLILLCGRFLAVSPSYAAASCGTPSGSYPNRGYTPTLTSSSRGLSCP